MPDLHPITPDLFAFLEELSENNNREWFNANKPRYQSDVQNAVVAWIEQWVKPLAKAAPMLSVIPKRSGGSLMRIYRDTRFSKDKTPYKTNVGISLRHQADGDIHAPGVYVHLAANECFIGAGCWRPPRQTLAAIRDAIDCDPKAWRRARDQKQFRNTFTLAGDSLKTSPRDYAKDHPLIEDLRRIDFIGVASLTRDDILAPDATDRIVDHVKAARPLMRFICDAVDVPY
ncbi:MAG: DUF2461 domain-containing protein [Planctomycetota bacterium]